MSEAQNGAPSANALNVGSQPQATPQVAEPQVEASSEEGQVEGEEQLSKESQKELKRINKLMLKVHGQEVEEELPFDIEEDPEVVEYLTKQLQLSKAAQRAMQENTTFKKQVQDFFSNLKSNTRSTLEEMGIDPKEFAAAVIEEEIKRQQMSPEERERDELRAKLQKIEDERKREKEEFEKKEYERVLQAEYEKVESQVTAALDSAGLPKTPYSVKRVAAYLAYAAEKGVEMTAEEVAPYVRDEIKKEIQEMIQAVGEDKAEDLIGKDVINKIRKRNISKAKQTPASVKSQIKDVGQSLKRNDGPVEKIPMKNFFGKI